MGDFQLSGAEALHLWVTVAVLFVVAKLLGAFMRRLGQPAVVGALLAGVVIGPSGLGAVWPAVPAFVLPVGAGAQLLGAILGFCLLLLLIMLGAETDPTLLRRAGRPVVAVSAGSILIPLMAGSLVAFAFAGALFPRHPVLGALLLGGALGVSSLPIIAQLVTELGLSRRNFGQLAVAAAVVNDVYGFVLLVVTGSIARSGGGIATMALPIVGLFLVTVVLLVIGQRTVDYLLRHTRTEGPNPTAAIAMAVAVALTTAAVMQVFGVDAALGAFFAGAIVGRSRFRHSSALRQLRSFNESVFAPLYFAGAGLQANVWLVDSWQRLSALGSLFAVAIAVKAVGAGLGAYVVRLDRRECVALAVLLNGRGTMQVIIGGAALRSGLFSYTAFTVLLIVSIGSSVAVSPVVRRLIGDWLGTRVERERLAHEQRLRCNVMVRGQRLLLPLVSGTPTAFTASIMDRAWPDEAEISVLYSARNGGAVPRVNRTLRRCLAAAFDPVDAVLAEAKFGYGMIGIGLPAVPDSGTGAFVEELLGCTPLPVVLAKPGQQSGIGPWRSVAVGTKGTTACRAAEEIAIALCRHDNAQLYMLHVAPPASMSRSSHARTAGAVLDETRVRARAMGLAPELRCSTGLDPRDDLSTLMRDEDVDMLVVGARVRRTGAGIFLGRTVAGLLRAETPFAVVVAVFPDAAPSERDEPYVECDAQVPRRRLHSGIRQVGTGLPARPFLL